LLDLHREVEREHAEQHGTDDEWDVAAVVVQFSRQWQAKYSVALLLFGSLVRGLPLSGDTALLEHFRGRRSEFTGALGESMVQGQGYKVTRQLLLTTVP
tara:strand:- start:217 stop:513 length:297 start_codon:yes stop_codon:yes gene_type:complete